MTQPDRGRIIQYQTVQLARDLQKFLETELTVVEEMYATGYEYEQAFHLLQPRFDMAADLLVAQLTHTAEQAPE